MFFDYCDLYAATEAPPPNTARIAEWSKTLGASALRAWVRVQSGAYFLDECFIDYMV